VKQFFCGVGDECPAFSFDVGGPERRREGDDL